MIKWYSFLLYFLCVGFTGTALGREPVSFIDVMGNIINESPEINAKWHAYQASQYDISSSKADYLPVLSLDGNLGYETRTNLQSTGGTDSQVNLNIKQVLYNGFATGFQTQYYKDVSLAAYYELLDSIENVTLEAYTAFEDVDRYRNLLAIAKKNLIKNSEIYEKISHKTAVGLGRKSDLEQAASKLYLSQSNVFTEQSNLYDVSARFQRITGKNPPKKLSVSNFPVPEGLFDALMYAYRHNYQLRASGSNIKSAASLVKKQKTEYQPKLTLVGRYGMPDYSYYDSSKNDLYGRIGLEFTVNLYKGGKDSSNVSKAMEDVNSAKSLMLKNCFDVRQTLKIAFNDIAQLNLQIPLLTKQKNSTDKVNESYIEQFAISEHSLLKILESVNEAFESKRSVINAVHDMAIAKARLLASMGDLVATLQVEGGSKMDSIAFQAMLDKNSESESMCPTIENQDFNNEILAKKSKN
jgi:adhesin transport system outer membrane protein